MNRALQGTKTLISTKLMCSGTLVLLHYDEGKIQHLVASHNNHLLSMAYTFAALVFDTPSEQQWLIERFEMYKKDLLENKNRVDELLSSPLGVMVLAASIIEVSGPPPDLPWIEAHLGWTTVADIARCLQALSAREPVDDCFHQLSEEDFSELIARCETDLTPYSDDYPEQAETLLASGSALRSFAECLLQAPGTASWFADLDHQHQEWMTCTDLAPEASCFQPDFRCWGAGITKPRQVFWTSTSVGECSSNWLHYIHRGEDRAFWEPPYQRWRLEVLPTARVYEVHGPQAWQSLCLTYPAPSCIPYPFCRPDALIEPDWQAVAQDWDGIHLSVGGLLTAERVKWGRPGAQTHLYGWGVESTLWLHWVFRGTTTL